MATSGAAMRVGRDVAGTWMRRMGSPSCGLALDVVDSRCAIQGSGRDREGRAVLACAVAVGGVSGPRGLVLAITSSEQSAHLFDASVDALPVGLVADAVEIGSRGRHFPFLGHAGTAAALSTHACTAIVCKSLRFGQRERNSSIASFTSAWTPWERRAWP